MGHHLDKAHKEGIPNVLICSLLQNMTNHTVAGLCRWFGFQKYLQEPPTVILNLQKGELVPGRFVWSAAAPSKGLHSRSKCPRLKELVVKLHRNRQWCIPPPPPQKHCLKQKKEWACSSLSWSSLDRISGKTCKKQNKSFRAKGNNSTLMCDTNGSNLWVRVE